jgi:hypothetical protein
MDTKRQKTCNYKISGGFLTLNTNDNADITAQILTFCSVTDLGNLMRASVGAYHTCNEDLVWASRVQSMEAHDPALFWWGNGTTEGGVPVNYPANIPRKKAYAIMAYLHLNGLKSGKVGMQPWNPTTSKCIFDHTCRNLISSEKSVVICRRKLTNNKKRLEAALEHLRARLLVLRRAFDAHDFAALQNATAAWERTMNAVSYRKENYAVAQNALTTGLSTLTFHRTRNARWVERKRLYETFAPYLRYFWFFGQTMRNERRERGEEDPYEGPWAVPPRTVGTHSMKLRNTL